ncbi:hypothetical protein PMIN05_003954 [Paraphaeosphaeria minitans]
MTCRTAALIVMHQPTELIMQCRSTPRVHINACFDSPEALTTHVRHHPTTLDSRCQSLPEASIYLQYLGIRAPAIMFNFSSRFSAKSPSRHRGTADPSSATVKTEDPTDVLSTAEADEGVRKHMHAPVEGVMATEKHLSANAGHASKIMTKLAAEFKTFHGILLGIQKAERDHKAELLDVEESIQRQQDILHHLADQIGSTDDDEVNCKAIDDANAKIRELKANEKKIHTMLEQSQIDREDLEGRLSTHQAEVDHVMTEVQDSAQDQPEAKRLNPGHGKRSLSRTLKKFTGAAGPADAVSSSTYPAYPALPVNFQAPSGGDRRIAPALTHLLEQSTSDVVASFSRSSPGSSMDDPDDGDLT